MRMPKNTDRGRAGHSCKIANCDEPNLHPFIIRCLGGLHDSTHRCANPIRCGTHRDAEGSINIYANKADVTLKTKPQSPHASCHPRGSGSSVMHAEDTAFAVTFGSRLSAYLRRILEQRKLVIVLWTAVVSGH